MKTTRYLIESHDNMYSVYAYTVEEVGTTSDYHYLYKQGEIAFSDLKPHFMGKLAEALRTRYEEDMTPPTPTVEDWHERTARVMATSLADADHAGISDERDYDA